jgi:hypothetical protein
MRDAGYEIRDAGYEIRDTGYEMRDAGYEMRDTRYGMRIRGRNCKQQTINRKLFLFFLLLPHIGERNIQFKSH